MILRLDGAQGFVAVTYVPDKAPVRMKMLFASTRLTLVRELGELGFFATNLYIHLLSQRSVHFQKRIYSSQKRTGPDHFTETLFATTKAELTASGWAKHEAHGSLSAPLTEEEQNLVGIREAEARESMGTGTRRGGHVSRDVSLAVDGEAVEALKGLVRGEFALVQIVSAYCPHTFLSSLLLATQRMPTEQSNTNRKSTSKTNASPSPPPTPRRSPLPPSPPSSPHPAPAIPSTPCLKKLSSSTPARPQAQSSKK